MAVSPHIKIRGQNEILCLKTLILHPEFHMLQELRDE